MPLPPQVVGRAEPHNLRNGHPEQHRVVTMRENARIQVRRGMRAGAAWPLPLQAWQRCTHPAACRCCASRRLRSNLPCLAPSPSLFLLLPSPQGFPDYHVLVAKPSLTGKGFIRNASSNQRYQQMGNAVSPQVASALGRCLARAALHESPPGAMLVAAPDPEYEQVGL